MNEMSNHFSLQSVTVIGAGLAGCEAAYCLAENNIKVKLYEMKPNKKTPAHSYNGYAELVCSNSLKSNALASAPGLLKEEMRRMGSLIIESADKNSTPAGGALAVDRVKFSDYITEKIQSNPNITVVNEEITQIPPGICVIATGPLSTLDLSSLCGDGLSFYDASAPIISADSIDTNIAFSANRYGKGDDDYINCPFTKEEYETFHKELVSAERAVLHDFDVYEGCMPIEVLAKRGEDSIRFGPLKPVGFTDPRTGKRPYAVVQLRKESLADLSYNIVGFQTNLKFPEQQRVFRLIPGLADAEFLRFGVMHRNTYINSPKLLSKNLSLKENPNIFFAGQITGVEGYNASAMTGLYVAKNIIGDFSLSEKTMSGALIAYITLCGGKFTPMGPNMGLLPPLGERVKDKKLRYEKMANLALLNLSSA
ncbi:MAG: methylenetetrahydrofolate--tRNA-(uracil(54)-C(5))-methyltransferase (FADH(2)-oxidizing) TrmFO [Ruminococcus sp.]|nr:methylenetetrahydrofolate--tRNA-(uracil(54)-C(5))-methyltransferase (FADH(2)-oxidizing) TrmFO [Ruminococcus sp.]